jgi:hypothetical protein
MAESTIHDQIERAAKALPLALAGLYVAGFIIVAFRLAGYGASSLDLFRIQYVAAGFWFGVFCSIFFIFSDACRRVMGQYLFQRIQHTARRKLLERIEARELAGAIAGDCFLVAVAAGISFVGSKIQQRLAVGVRPTPPHLFWFFLTVASMDVSIRAWLFYKSKQEEEGIPWAYNVNFCVLFLAISVMFSLQIFALSIYPALPFPVGGGQTREVVFWLGPHSTAAFLERDGDSGYTVPYELPLENENSFVVISPKDNQRSIEFDRKVVEGMVVLGKRSQSAPANFQRNVSEPTNNKYEVIERSQKDVPNFMASGSHTEVDYVLLRGGRKFYATCDTTTLNKLDPTATCAFRVLRSYECVMPNETDPKKALSDLTCKDDEGHPVYLYVAKKE